MNVKQQTYTLNENNENANNDSNERTKTTMNKFKQRPMPISEIYFPRAKAVLRNIIFGTPSRDIPQYPSCTNDILADKVSLITEEVAPDLTSFELVAQPDKLSIVGNVFVGDERAQVKIFDLDWIENVAEIKYIQKELTQYISACVLYMFRYLDSRDRRELMGAQHAVTNPLFDLMLINYVMGVKLGNLSKMPKYYVRVIHFGRKIAFSHLLHILRFNVEISPQIQEEMMTKLNFVVPRLRPTATKTKDNSDTEQDSVPVVPDIQGQRLRLLIRDCSNVRVYYDTFVRLPAMFNRNEANNDETTVEIETDELKSML